jgi:hypothetical protein
MAEMNGQGELSLSRLLMDLHVDDAHLKGFASELHLPMPTFSPLGRAVACSHLVYAVANGIASSRYP